MKRMALVSILFGLLISFGCAPTLPSKSVVNDAYSLEGVKTFSSVVDCENVQITELKTDFSKDYCQVLAGNIKISLQRENPGLTYDESHPDLVVQTTLEEIHGGSAAARFWVGFGAGRSITTVYVKVIKLGVTIAERRITETTTMPNLVTSNFSNEDAILQDATLLARRIGRFVKDPVNFEKQ